MSWSQETDASFGESTECPKVGDLLGDNRDGVWCRRWCRRGVGSLLDSDFISSSLSPTSAPFRSGNPKLGRGDFTRLGRGAKLLGRPRAKGGTDDMGGGLGRCWPPILSPTDEGSLRGLSKASLVESFARLLSLCTS